MEEREGEKIMMKKRERELRRNRNVFFRICQMYIISTERVYCFHQYAVCSMQYAFYLGIETTDLGVVVRPLVWPLNYKNICKAFSCVSVRVYF